MAAYSLGSSGFRPFELLLELDLRDDLVGAARLRTCTPMPNFGLFRKTMNLEAEETAAVFAALSPFRIEPHFDPRVWGWRDLRPWYDCVVAEGEGTPPPSAAYVSKVPIGEVWLTGDDCKVATGAHKDQPLSQVFREQPEAMLGNKAPSTGSPLLIKVIFAREKLSVQVHPDDKLAQKYGQPRGKTECWYVLAAEPEALVAAGLKIGSTLDQVRSGIQDGTLEDCLKMLPVVAGDMVFMDAGTVHAIWPGSVLLETQQNCDITYRMYDYGRPRELHIEKSLEAMRFETRAGKVSPRVLPDRTVLIDQDYFCVERIPVQTSRASTTLPSPDESEPGLSYLFAAAGSGRLTSPSFEGIDLPQRGIVAVPASSPIFAVQDLGGLDLIRMSPRWPKQ
jgi:mannose-6-phosphate isomerase